MTAQPPPPPQFGSQPAGAHSGGPGGHGVPGGPGGPGVPSGPSGPGGPSDPGGPGGPGTPRSSRDGFFSALFDLKFERFITLRFATVIYVICIVLAILSWLGTILSAILAATAQSALMSYASYYGGIDAGMGAGGVLMIVAAILLGWIPSLLMVICSRIILEFIVASVRTATNTQTLVDRGVL